MCTDTHTHHFVRTGRIYKTIIRSHDADNDDHDDSDCLLNVTCLLHVTLLVMLTEIINFVGGDSMDE